MKEVKVKVYKFDELEDKIKEKVIEKFQNENDFVFLSDFLKDELEILLNEKGIKSDNAVIMNYNLSYSQGSGVAINGCFEYKDFFIKIEARDEFKNSMNFNISKDYNDVENEKIINKIKNMFYEICDKLMKFGYDTIEYENSEEAIKENIENNEFLFRKNGKIWVSD